MDAIGIPQSVYNTTDMLLSATDTINDVVGNGIENVSSSLPGWTSNSTASRQEETSIAYDDNQNTSSDGRVEFYFQMAVVIITFIGTIANGIVLYALLFAPGNKKKSVNVLLINQTLIDFYSSFILLVTYIVKLCNIYLTGSVGYWLCMILTGEMLAWFGLNSSMINLGVITVERYLMVVHSVWHKNHFRLWMTYAGCVFSWASGSVMNFFLYLFTTDVVDGQCLAVVEWKKKSDNVIYGIWYYLYYFQLPLCLFIFCYSRILAVIRRQNRVFQGKQHPTTGPTTASAGSSESHQKTSRSEMNAIRTMITLTAFFAVSWLPNHLYYLILNVADSSLNLLGNGWYGTLFIAFLNICANPFIYVASYDDVKNFLGKKLGFKGNSDGKSTDHSMNSTKTAVEHMH